MKMLLVLMTLFFCASLGATEEWVPSAVGLAVMDEDLDAVRVSVYGEDLFYASGHENGYHVGVAPWLTNKFRYAFGVGRNLDGNDSWSAEVAGHYDVGAPGDFAIQAGFDFGESAPFAGVYYRFGKSPR